MNPLGIYITSANRADKQITIHHLPPSLQEITTLVVPQDQLDEYNRAVENTLVNVWPAPVNLMSPKRQWAIENAQEKFFWMMDDDIDFFKRGPDMKLKKATQEDIIDMYDMVVAQLMEGTHPFIGISSRLGNNRITEDFHDIGRVSRCWAFDRELYIKLGINIVPFPEYCIDDFHIILSFLEHGYPNRVFYNYSQEDKGSNSAGGCSVYRNYDIQRKSALWLMKQHPKSVDIKAKQTKSTWEGMESRKGIEGSNRVDVVVQWQKAYNPKPVKKAGGFSSFMKKKG